MENISKALLIAAGMLIVMMLLTLVIIGYNKISFYYELQHESIIVEQLDKFNKQFQNYSGKVIRGNELISLMNKIIDYNASQSYQEGIEYKPIKVKIHIGSEHIDEFRYKIDGDRLGVSNDNLKIDSNGDITNTGVGGANDWESDKKLVEITNTPTHLINDIAKPAGINDLTDTQLQKLTMEISSILMRDEDERKTENQQKENRRIRAIVLKNILKFEIGKVGNTKPGITYDIILNNDYIATTRSRKN